MKNKKITLTVIAILVLLLTLVSATYAYFTSFSPNNIANINATVNLGTSNSAFSSLGGEIILNTGSINMEQRKSGNIAAENNGTINVTYLAGINEKLECTYDIYYKWYDTSDSYTKPASIVKEFTYTLTLGESPVVKETNFASSSNNPTLVYSGKIKNDSETVSTNQSYGIDVKYYNLDTDQTSQASKTWKLKFYVDNVVCGEQAPTVNLLAKLDSLVEDNDVVESGSKGSLQKQTVSVEQNETIGINSSSYTNLIYTGKNPNNFIEFNGEMWRIIGVFNEDSHGITGQRLVKIIRNDNLIVSSEDTSSAKVKWDCKFGRVGSGPSYMGTNEWSDSQLMFMLNGESAINKGKIYDGSTYTYANTKVDGDFIQTRTNEDAYHDLWNKSSGSYLSYDRSGYAIIDKEIYTSSQASESSYSAKKAVLAKTISRDAQDKIQEVTWHLGGVPNYTTDGFVSHFYTYERGITLYPSSSTSSTQRSATWTGKIGLIYPSDFGYAYGGKKRNTCLTDYTLSSWNSHACTSDSWLIYTGAGASDGVADFVWTISPNPSNNYSVFLVRNYSDVTSTTAYNNYALRPALYLKADTMIIDGDGSYSNPYIIE